MPIVRIFSAIDVEDKKRLREMAEKLRVSEYKLIQEAVLIYINEPEKSKEKSRLQRFLKFIEEDLKHTF